MTQHTVRKEMARRQDYTRNLTNGQTNPEGPARLTRRLIMDLVLVVIFENRV